MPTDSVDTALRREAVALATVAEATNFELIAESIPHIVFVASPDGWTEYFNRRGSQYAGLPSDAFLGWGWMSVVHPEDIGGARAAWDDAMRTEADYDRCYRIRRADGRFRWHRCRALPVRGGDGRVERWIGTYTDIDDEMALEHRLRAAERASAETLTLLDTLHANAPVGFGFIDREYRYSRVNETLATMNGVPVDAHIGRRVAEVVPDLWPQLEPRYREVLDTGEPVVNLEMAGETAAHPGQEQAWLVNLYPVRLGAEIIGIGLVVVDITERRHAERTYRELTHAAVAAIASTVEARDPYTAGHQRRVAEISEAIGRKIGLDEHAIVGVSLAAHIHDIGKLAVPAEILARPGPLHPAEMELVKTHSRAGHDIVAGIDFPWPVAEMILQHHERLDGRGYPQGLRGDEIVIGARIIAVADTVEAMASHRPYRPSVGLAAALDELTAGRGTAFDPVVVDACLGLFRGGELEVAGWSDLSG